MLPKILTPMLFAHFIFISYAEKVTSLVYTEEVDYKEVINEVSKPLTFFPGRINNRLRHPELTEVLLSLFALEKGKFKAISDTFSSDNNEWCWTIMEGILPENIIGQTNYFDNCVITTLDYGKLCKATNLFVAGNILHEMAHAYLTLYYRFNPFAARKDYPKIYSEWKSNERFDYNDAQHEEIESQFEQDIFYTLKAYSESIHLAPNEKVLTDLAWGGLDFINNSQLLETDKERIQNRLLSELFNRHTGTENPYGTRLSLINSSNKKNEVLKLKRNCGNRL